MNQVPTLALTILVSLALLPHGAALHCNGNILTIPVGDETFYIDDRSAANDYQPVYVYMEGNDRPGLQSGTDYPTICGPDDPLCFIDSCFHLDPDLLLY